MKIEIQEVIAGLESQNVGRLTAMWTTVAFTEAKGDFQEARELCVEYGCEKGWYAVADHAGSLPANQRGFIKSTEKEIEEFLRVSYKQGSNPLPTLRKKHGGEWQFFADYGRRVDSRGHAIGDPLPKVSEDAVMFSPEEPGKWRVFWTPAK